MGGFLSRRWFFPVIFFLSVSVGFFYSVSEKSGNSMIVSPVVPGTTVRTSKTTTGRGSFSFLTNLVPSGKADRKDPSTGAVLGEKTGRRMFSPPATLPPAVSLTPTPQPASYDSRSTPSPTPLQNDESATTPTPTPTPSPSPTVSAFTGTPTPSPPSSLSPSQTEVMAVSQTVIEFLVSRSFDKLYEMMSVDFKDYFSEEDFVASFSSSSDVDSGQLKSVPRIYGNNSEWAEQSVVLVLSSGVSKNYLLIFHRENNVWKFYATEENL